MQYTNLGKSGLKVSVISLGNMVNNKPENYEEDKNIVKRCLEAGINFFDTAEIYAMGESEKTLGIHICDHRKYIQGPERASGEYYCRHQGLDKPRR
jgi:aryl-alcohol dehydrogenase-like predicted oxidoreductase